MAGFVYAVCNSTEFHRTKCGFTTSMCPASYCIREYSRTMPDLTTRHFMHVPDAHLAERLLFAALAPYRLDTRHEVFDVDDDDLKLGFDSVKEAFTALRKSNPAMTPQNVRPLTVKEYQIHRRSLVLGKRKRKSEATQKRQAERVAALEAERRELKHVKEQERARATERIRLVAQEKKDERREELIAKLTTFIDKHCVRGHTSSTRVETGVFRQAFSRVQPGARVCTGHGRLYGGDGFYQEANSTR